MTMSLLFFLILLTTVLGQQVILPSGIIEGHYLASRDGRQFAAYEGIPYAEPPLGILRFMPAKVPVSPWEGVKNCTMVPPVCAQPMTSQPFFRGQEDCLYLNVFQPQLPANNNSLLPVMVWIHGGSLIVGSGRSVGPEFLMDEDIVMVSINYRLGALGFLSLDTPEISGNQGLRDQTEALKWVQQNIHFFGGDSSKVTIFGESAGSWSVVHQILNPQSKGLFRAAIGQSGSIVGGLSGEIPLTRDEARDNAEKIATYLSCYYGDDWEAALQQTIDCLRFTYSYELSLVSSIFGLHTRANIDDFSAFGPILPQQPETLMEFGLHNNVTVLLGMNSGEEIMFHSDIIDHPFLLDTYNDHWSVVGPNLIMGRSLYSNGSDYGPYDEEYSVKAMEFYFNNSLGQDNLQDMFDLLNDAHFFRGIHKTVLLLSRSVPVYQYLLTFRDETSFTATPGNYSHIGVGHADDIYYIFHKDNRDYSTWSQAVMDTSRMMVKMWANFATEMNPTPDEQFGITWEAVKEEDPEYLNIGEHLVMEMDEKYRKRMEFWDNTIKN